MTDNPEAALLSDIRAWTMRGYGATQEQICRWEWWLSEILDNRRAVPTRTDAEQAFLEAAKAFAKIMRRDLRNKPDAEQYGRAIDIARHEFYEAHRALEEKPDA